MIGNRRATLKSGLSVQIKHLQLLNRVKTRGLCESVRGRRLSQRPLLTQNVVQYFFHLQGYNRHDLFRQGTFREA